MTIRLISRARSITSTALLTMLVLLPFSPAQGEVQVEEDEYVVFYHHDALGSPALTTDERGDALWYENVEPYGRSLGRKGVSGASYDADPFDEVEEEGRSRVAYTGHVRDGASDLIYMQQRHYDPELGRFLSNDPVGFTAANPLSFNRYAYANDNPYAYIDPDGRSAVLYLSGLLVESYEGITGRGDGQFNGDMALGALTDGYNGDRDVSGVLGALAQDAEAVLEIATAGVAGAIGRGAKAGAAAATPSNADDLADYAGSYGRSVGASQRVPKVLQTGENRLNNRTARELNSQLGESLNRREWGRALEGMKKDLGLPGDHHGRIMDNGDYVNDGGDILGNLLDHTP